MSRAGAILATLVAAGVGGCKPDPAARAERRALALVGAARSPAGLDASFVDEELVEQARRIQLVRRTTLDTYDPARLGAVLAGEAGPDRRYPAADRPQAQRDRATRGLRASLGGECRAHDDPVALKERLRYLVEPMPGVPAEVTAAQAEMGRALAGARAVRVECATGRVGVLLVERGGELRAVDLFPIGASMIEINPNDPSMR